MEIKHIRVDALIELLKTLPPDYEIGARTRAQTGNLTIAAAGGERQVGYIDLLEHKIELFDEDAGGDSQVK